jgi:hypothetical protein
VRIFNPLARAVAAETATAIAPALDETARSVLDMRAELAAVVARLDRLLTVVERIEAERPGWLATQRVSDLEQHWTSFVQPLSTPPVPNGRTI